MPNWINIKAGFEDHSDLKRWNKKIKKSEKLVEVFSESSFWIKWKSKQMENYKNLSLVMKDMNKEYQEIKRLIWINWEVDEKTDLVQLEKKLKNIFVLYDILHKNHIPQIRKNENLWDEEQHNSNADEIITTANMYMLEIFIRLANFLNNSSNFSNLWHFDKNLKNSDWLLMKLRYFYNKILKKINYKISKSSTENQNDDLITRAEKIYSQISSKQKFSHIKDIKDEDSVFLGRPRNKTGNRKIWKTTKKK